MNDRLHYLMQRHLHAALTPDEAAELAAALSDEEAAGAAIAACLRETTEASRYEWFHDLDEEDDADPPAPRRRRARWIGLAVLAAALIGAAAWISTVAPPELPKPVNAGLPPGLRPLESSAGIPVVKGSRVFISGTAHQRRELRQFTGGPLLREVTVSRALQELEAAWKARPNAAGSVPFQIHAALKARWSPPNTEPVISIELPGTSLLTQLELLAALSGAQLVIQEDAVILEPSSRETPPGTRTWSLPLSVEVLHHYGNEARMAESPPSWSNAGDALFPVVPPPPAYAQGTLEFDAPPSPLLQRILEAHGVEGATGYDSIAGVLSIKAPLPQLRATSIIVRAIEEAARIQQR
jgi:hypothetical protein